MNFYIILLFSGYPVSNWCSDLYIEVNEKTTLLVNDYEYKQNVTLFHDNVTGKKSYEIPFCYDYKLFGDLN